MTIKGKYQIRDKRLEQFLFCHDIFFETSYRDEFGSTVWVYADTELIRSVLMEWKEILKRRNARKDGGKYVNPLPKRVEE